MQFETAAVGARSLDAEQLSTIREAPDMENSSTGSSRSIPSHISVGDAEPRDALGCAGCFGRKDVEGVQAHDRPLVRRGKKGDDLVALPIRTAKDRLLRALEEDDEPRCPCVRAAAADLAREALAAAPADWTRPQKPEDAAKLATGRWRALTKAEFPGALGKNERGEYEYPLGRMSFGLFDPADVVVAVEDCVNVILPCAQTPEVPKALVEQRIRARKPPVDARDVRRYDIETRFVVSDERGAGLRGRLATRGFCVSAPRGAEAVDACHRLDVWFEGGDIEPLDNDPAQLARWASLFGAASLPEPPLTKRFGRWLLGVVLGIELAAPEPRGVQRYSVAKPMLGFVDVLYADGDLRVTRGNRGTLVITRAVDAKRGGAK